jgi:excisionase family DNA binding protein
VVTPQPPVSAMDPLVAPQPDRPDLRDLDLLTPDDVCTLLKVKKSWVYDEVEAGRLDALRLGKQLCFRPSDLARYLDGRARGQPWCAAELSAESQPLPVERLLVPGRLDKQLPAGGHEEDPMAVAERDYIRQSTHRHALPADYGRPLLTGPRTVPEHRSSVTAPLTTGYESSSGPYP